MLSPMECRNYKSSSGARGPFRLIAWIRLMDNFVLSLSSTSLFHDQCTRCGGCSPALCKRVQDVVTCGVSFNAHHHHHHLLWKLIILGTNAACRTRLGGVIFSKLFFLKMPTPSHPLIRCWRRSRDADVPRLVRWWWRFCPW